MKKVVHLVDRRAKVENLSQAFPTLPSPWRTTNDERRRRRRTKDDGPTEVRPMVRPTTTTTSDMSQGPCRSSSSVPPALSLSRSVYLLYCLPCLKKEKSFCKSFWAAVKKSRFFFLLLSTTCKVVKLAVPLCSLLSLFCRPWQQEKKKLRLIKEVT